MKNECNNFKRNKSLWSKYFFVDWLEIKLCRRMWQNDNKVTQTQIVIFGRYHLMPAMKESREQEMKIFWGVKRVTTMLVENDKHFASAIWASTDSPQAAHNPTDLCQNDQWTMPNVVTKWRHAKVFDLTSLCLLFMHDFHAFLLVAIKVTFNIAWAENWFIYPVDWLLRYIL